MRTFWENERRKLLGQPLIQDDDNQADTAINAPNTAVLAQAEEELIVTPTIGILSGFYVGATNDGNYNIAKRDILEDRKSTRLNSSHSIASRMPSSA